MPTDRRLSVCTRVLKHPLDRTGTKRVHANNINRDSGIDFPEAWMPAKLTALTFDTVYLDQYFPNTVQ